MSNIGDFLKEPHINIGAKIQIQADQWNTTGQAVIGKIGARCITVILKPLVKILDAALNIIIGLGKIIAGLVLDPAELVVNDENERSYLFNQGTRQLARVSYDLGDALLSIIPNLRDPSDHEEVQIHNLKNQLENNGKAQTDAPRAAGKEPLKTALTSQDTTVENDDEEQEELYLDLSLARKNLAGTMRRVAKAKKNPSLTSASSANTSAELPAANTMEDAKKIINGLLEYHGMSEDFNLNNLDTIKQRTFEELVKVQIAFDKTADKKDLHRLFNWIKPLGKKEGDIVTPPKLNKVLAKKVKTIEHISNIILSLTGQSTHVHTSSKTLRRNFPTAELYSKHAVYFDLLRSLRSLAQLNFLINKIANKPQIQPPCFGLSLPQPTEKTASSGLPAAAIPPPPPPPRAAPPQPRTAAKKSESLTGAKAISLADQLSSAHPLRKVDKPQTASDKPESSVTTVLAAAVTSKRGYHAYSSDEEDDPNAESAGW